jgi:signal transduction histidine kinase
MSAVPAHEDIGTLWLHTLQRAMDRASHDVNDALNGVSVNLEVIRTRSARPDAPASAVASFGEAAAQQVERLSKLIEAVMALSRSERTPADVGLTLRRIVTLSAASSSSGDAHVRLIDDGTVGSTLTRVRGDVVRLALLAPLLEVVAGSDSANRASEVECRLTGDDNEVQVGIVAADRRVTAPENVVEVVRAAGVRWTNGDKSLSLAFPRA